MRCRAGCDRLSPYCQSSHADTITDCVLLDSPGEANYRKTVGTTGKLIGENQLRNSVIKNTCSSAPAAATRRATAGYVLRSAGSSPAALSGGNIPLADAHEVATCVRMHVLQPVAHALEPLLEIDERVRLVLRDLALVLGPYGLRLVPANDQRQALEQSIRGGIAVAHPLVRVLHLVAVEEVGVVDAELRDPADDERVEIAPYRIVDLTEQRAPLEDARLHIDADLAQVRLHDLDDITTDLVSLIGLHLEAERLPLRIAQNAIGAGRPPGFPEQLLRAFDIILQILARLGVILPEEGWHRRIRDRAVAAQHAVHDRLSVDRHGERPAHPRVLEHGLALIPANDDESAVGERDQASQLGSGDPLRLLGRRSDVVIDAAGEQLRQQRRRLRNRAINDTVDIGPAPQLRGKLRVRLEHPVLPRRA